MAFSKRLKLPCGTSVMHIRANNENESRTLTVHAQIVCKNTSFFGDGSDEEEAWDKRNVYDIACNPIAFEVFVNWLYGIPLRHHNSLQEWSSPDDCELRIETLLNDCYHLAKSIACKRFQNADIDYIEEAHAGWDWTFGSDMGKIFSNDDKTCQLKRWYAAFILYCVKANNKYNTECQNEFIQTPEIIPWFLDATRALDVDETGEANPNPREFDSEFYTECYFHDHDGEEGECSTEAL